MPILVHQIIEASLAEPRKSKHELSTYIDDIYLQGATQKECIKI